MNQAALRVRRDTGRDAAPQERTGKTHKTWPDPYPGTEEPRLSDLFDDDVMRCVMISDRVGSESLTSLIADTRGRLGL